MLRREPECGRLISNHFSYGEIDSPQIAEFETGTPTSCRRLACGRFFRRRSAVVVDYLAVRVVDRLEDCRRIGRLGHLLRLPIDSIRHLRIIKALTFDKLDQLRNFLLANHRELQRQLGATLGKSTEPCLQYGAADLIRPNSCLALFGAPKGNALHRSRTGSAQWTEGVLVFCG